MPKPKSTYQREMERRSNDLLRVYNPTDEDYVIEWDRKEGVKLFRAHAKQEAVFIRYIAEKYLKEMFDKIITEKADKAVEKENAKRLKKGMEEMSKWKDQFKFESKFYSIDDVEAQKILAILYVGIDTEYGVDRESQAEIVEQADDRPVFKKAMDTVQEEKDKVPETAPKTQEELDRPDYTKPPPKPPQGLRQSEFKCNYPGCGYVSKAKIGLFQHKKSHRDEKPVKPEATEPPPAEDVTEKKKQATEGVSQ